MRKGNLKLCVLTLVVTGFSALSSCSDKTIESIQHAAIPTQIVGVPTPDDGRREVLDFPAPVWEIGDWWEIDYENYISAVEVKKQPMGYDLKEGWAEPERWRYEVIGNETVRGDDCHMIEISNGGTFIRMWHRKTDLLVMRISRDNAYNRKQRIERPSEAWKFKEVRQEVDALMPWGHTANKTLPLAVPLFGAARPGLSHTQKIEPVSLERVAEHASPLVRSRLNTLSGARSAEIVIDTGGRGGIPDTQYWVESLPWCVFGEEISKINPHRCRYRLVDYGKKGEDHDSTQP